MNLCKNDFFLVYSFITYIILCVQIILLLGSIFNKKNKDVSSNARSLYYYHIQELFTALIVSTLAYMHHGLSEVSTLSRTCHTIGLSTEKLLRSLSNFVLHIFPKINYSFTHSQSLFVFYCFRSSFSSSS